VKESAQIFTDFALEGYGPPTNRDEDDLPDIRSRLI